MFPSVFGKFRKNRNFEKFFQHNFFDFQYFWTKFWFSWKSDQVSTVRCNEMQWDAMRRKLRVTEGQSILPGGSQIPGILDNKGNKNDMDTKSDLTVLPRALEVRNRSDLITFPWKIKFRPKILKIKKVMLKKLFEIFDFFWNFPKTEGKIFFLQKIL